MTKIEELLEDAYDDVRADVVATIRAHPQYAQFVNELAARGVKELFTLVSAGGV